MAHIQKRSDNSWRLVVERGYDATGKRLTPARTTIRVDDPALLRAPKRLENFLNDELVRFKMEVEAGTNKRPEKKSFASWVGEWDQLHVSGLEYKTRENYRFHCESRIIPHFGKMYMDEIKTMHLVQFMAKLREPGMRLDGKPGKLGSGSLVYIYRVLLSIFTKAKEWNIIKENPMDGVDKPEENDKKKIRFYNEEELEQLFDALERDIYEDPRYKEPRYKDERMMLQVLVTLDLTTGMRRAELLGLSWKVIDLDRGFCEVLDTIPAYENGEPVIKRPKNDEPRVIALTKSVLEMLREYKEHQKKQARALAGKDNVIPFNDDDFDQYLFLNIKTGKPLYPSTIGKKWVAFHERHPYLKYIPFHGIRHTATSVMISKDVHAKAIANRLGWKNIKMVDHYGHIFESVDQAAAAVFEDVIPQKNRKKQNGS